MKARSTRRKRSPGRIDLTRAKPLPLVSGAAPELTLSAAEGRDAAVSRAAAAALASVRTWDLVCETRGREFFTAERVAPGAVVSRGTVLVGRSSPRDAHLLSKEERTLDAIRGVKPTTFDTSLTCPRHVRGTVTAIDAGPTKVTVTILLSRELAVGDVLRTESGALAVVGAIVDEPPGGADVAWPGLSGRHVVHKVACAEDRLEARSHGAYAARDQQPLAVKEKGGVQRIGPGGVQALLARGARAVLHEMLTVKSDDLEGRFETYASVVKGAPAALPTVPVSTRTLEATLRALAFLVDFAADEPAIALATTEAIRESCPFVVHEHGVIEKDDLAPRPGGLFSEEIFGRLGSPDRRRRLGRVELPVPILHPFATETAGVLLGMSADEVRAVVDHKAVLPRHADLDEPPHGAVALREALAELDLPALASAGGARGDIARSLLDAGLRAQDLTLDAWPVLPPDYRRYFRMGEDTFATADVNHLYSRVIRRAIRLRRLQELRAPWVIVHSEVLMLQEAISDTAQNGRWGMWIVGDDDKPLGSLIDEVVGPRGPLTLVLDGKRVDFAGAATVVARADLPPDRALIPRDAALEVYKPWVMAALGSARGRSAKVTGRLVDRRHKSALAALTGMPPLVLLPADDAPRVTSVETVLWDEAAVGLSPRTIEALGIAPGDAVAFHVPIGPEAVAEARTRLRGLVATEPMVEDDGWLTRATHTPWSGLGHFLYTAALHREQDPAKSTRARLLLGRRP